MPDNPFTPTDLTPPGTLEHLVSSTHTASEGHFNYTLVVQVPVPFIGLNFNLVGNVILPLLERTGIPEAVRWLEASAAAKFQKLVDTATRLIQVVPEASVTILVKVGPATIVNIQLVGVKVPVDVAVPSFVLDLPNLAVGLNLVLPIPSLPPVVVQVPIPVPRIGPLRFPRVEGGQVQASAEASPVAQPITNPIRLPII